MDAMKHDLAHSRRGAVIRASGKTRVTIYLDDDVIDFFREHAGAKGRGYQTEINIALRAVMEDGSRGPATRESADMTGLKLQIGELVRAVGRIDRRLAKASPKAG